MDRSRRRCLVAAGLVGYPLAVAVLAALKQTSLNRWLILAVFLDLVGLSAMAMILIYRLARGRMGAARTVRLDERERALCEQAYVLSHQLLAAILVLAVLGSEGYLAAGNQVRVNGNFFLPVLMWVVVYLPALPSMMLAWIEPTALADA